MNACICRVPRHAVPAEVGPFITNGWSARKVSLASYGVVGGSLVFVRLVPVRMPIPINTITPTAIHVGETPTRYAATAKPRMRTMKPTRYVLNDDILLSLLGLSHGRAIVGPDS